MDIQQSCFSGVMLAVGRLVGIEKTIGDKVSLKMRSVIQILPQPIPVAITTKFKTKSPLTRLV